MQRPATFAHVGPVVPRYASSDHSLAASMVFARVLDLEANFKLHFDPFFVVRQAHGQEHMRLQVL